MNSLSSFGGRDQHNPRGKGSIWVKREKQRVTSEIRVLSLKFDLETDLTMSRGRQKKVEETPSEPY